MAQSIFGAFGGLQSAAVPGSVPASLLKDQLQQNNFFDDEFEEPTSVLDLTSCISPPLQTDVWAEHAQMQLQVQANLQAQAQYVYEQQQAQAQYAAWEQQQQQMLMWEHQQQQMMLWGQQQAQFAMLNCNNNLMNGGSNISPCLSDDQLSVPCSWETHDQELGVPGMMNDLWMQNDFAAQCHEQYSSSNHHLPAMDDPFNFDAWISRDESQSSKCITEESVGSFVVNDDSGAYSIMADEVSSNSYDESGIASADLDSFVTTCEWNDELLQSMEQPGSPHQMGAQSTESNPIDENFDKIESALSNMDEDLSSCLQTTTTTVTTTTNESTKSSSTDQSVHFNQQPQQQQQWIQHPQPQQHNLQVPGNNNNMINPSPVSSSQQQQQHQRWIQHPNPQVQSQQQNLQVPRNNNNIINPSPGSSSLAYHSSGMIQTVQQQQQHGHHHDQNLQRQLQEVIQMSVAAAPIPLGVTNKNNNCNSTYNYMEERLKLSTERRVWQSHPSQPTNCSLTIASESAAGTYHGGMITKLDIPQGVGRMGMETSNARARMGADVSNTGIGTGGGTHLGSSEHHSPILNVRPPTAAETQNVGGVRMVQLLLACAEAVACRDSRQAAILLQQLQHMATPHGDSMQRVTSCFVAGLTARLAITGSQPLALKSIPAPRKPPNEAEKQEGFNLIYRASPYVAFGHFAANTAILEAFEGEDAVHVVDLGMTHALQWPHLILGLASRSGGPPRLLRITGFGLATEKMKEAGSELAEFAKLHNVNFEFRVVTESLENLQRSMLELRDGEALAVNSLLQLHCVVKESRGSLNAVLHSINDLSPKILTLVEQDASHNGPFFLGRFMEALHYYSAIFDSLDAILPRYSSQRVKMEQFHFAEEIKNIVSCEGPSRVERHERVDQWRRRMSRAGFQPLPLKFLSQARTWLGLYNCDGYTLAEEKGCLVLGWKGKPLIAASSWRC